MCMFTYSINMYVLQITCVIVLATLGTGENAFDLTLVIVCMFTYSINMYLR
jgi:hypothetical protein